MQPGWNEKSVFLAALDLPVGERAAYLAQACPDEATRARIEALLQHHAALTSDLADEVRPPALPGSDAPQPERIDEFLIVRRLGEGGMGVVFLAQDLLLGRPVALKILAPHMAGSKDALTRFQTEAQSTAAIKHPAIVPVFRFGTSGGTHYIVSEFVDGPTLAEMLEGERHRRTGQTGAVERRAWYRRSAEIIAVIADALDAAHRRDIIHRDVKPSNILLDREHGPRLTDFGIAKQMTHETRTGGTALVGSCHYMSPEQAAIAERRVDQRSDVFSLGVVLYEMLVLRRPFEGSDVPQVLRAVIADDPPRLRLLDRALPRDLEVICFKAIEKNPAHRYQTAAHMAADLRCFLMDQPILAQPPSWSRRLRHWARRRPTSLTAVAVLVLMGSLAAFAAHRIRQAEHASLAWLRLDLDNTPCRAYLQYVRPDTGAFNAPRSIEAGPGSVQRLPPGQYRLTLVRPADGAFCEFNLVLRQTGPAQERVVRLSDGRTPYPPDAVPADPAVPGRVLIGVLRGDAEFPETELLPVPGGTYDLAAGANIGKPLTTLAELAAFRIDARKVSNREYAEFVAVTGFRRPNLWQALGDPREHPDLPVVGVTIEEAEAYARWRGKRLPTLHEWQAAARGPAGDPFPGGQAPPADADPEPALLADSRTASAAQQLELYLRHALAVDRDPLPRAPGRPLQMFSSVRELTGSLDDELSNVFTPGRMWSEPVADLTLAIVSRAPRSMPSPHCGFRCARSVRVPDLLTLNTGEEP